MTDLSRNRNVSNWRFKAHTTSSLRILHGLAAHELKQEELDYHDPDYQVLITVRAVKVKGGEP